MSTSDLEKLFCQAIKPMNLQEMFCTKFYIAWVFAIPVGLSYLPYHPTLLWDWESSGSVLAACWSGPRSDAGTTSPWQTPGLVSAENDKVGDGKQHEDCIITKLHISNWHY